MKHHCPRPAEAAKGGIKQNNNMKVLITGHTPLEGKTWWYKKYLGQQIEIDDKEGGLYQNEYPRFLSTDKETGHRGYSILKQDCHLIQPAWEVMKEAWETNILVEYWNVEEKKWTNKGLVWFSDMVYRLKPEPVNPVIVPLEGEELADLVGKVVRDAHGLYFVTSALPSDGIIEVNGELFTSRVLLSHFTHLDGSPIGKEVKNG